MTKRSINLRFSRDILQICSFMFSVCVCFVWECVLLFCWEFIITRAEELVSIFGRYLSRGEEAAGPSLCVWFLCIHQCLFQRPLIRNLSKSVLSPSFTDRLSYSLPYMVKTWTTGITDPCHDNIIRWQKGDVKRSRGGQSINWMVY